MGVLKNQFPRGGGMRMRAIALAFGAAAVVAEPIAAQEATAAASFSVGADGRVRIEVPSAADRYHVLHYRAGPEAPEHPVALRMGAAGGVVLEEPLSLGQTGSYRVATWRADAPGDADGDGVDDLAEMARAEAGRRAPLNAAAAVDADLGAVAIPDLEGFRALSVRDPIWRGHVRLGTERVKFTVEPGRLPGVWFQDTGRYRDHTQFWIAANSRHGVGFAYRDFLRGHLAYHPNVTAPSGERGTFGYWLSQPPSIERVVAVHELIAASMPFLRNSLVYHPLSRDALARYQAEKALYDASRVPVYLEADLFERTAFRPLNAAVGYGLLRVVGSAERSGPRDVAVLRRLPNSMPRVAGVVSLERQTPLSHVNLRAAQDGVPNAYLGDALDDPAVAGLLGRYVRYEVSADAEERFAWTDADGVRIERAGFSITEATAEEVAAHHAARRPSEAQTPPRNLATRTHWSLDALAFADSDAFGAKAANLAALRTFALTGVEVPRGHALPFHYYDAFMKHNGFYADVDALLADPDFRADIAVRDAELAKLRRRIRNGAAPEWMTASLGTLQGLFASNAPIRCRSSTNNEDLPGFSGAGLYDSFTHHPDEGHLSKSVKQVFASLWNLRAFEEREFHRVDHKAAAMGVLMHPNYSGEQANGVAVTDDPFHGTEHSYYVNAQVGEELVTNPSANALPEELLLGVGEEFETMLLQRSNLVADGGRVLSDAHLATLRAALRRIHKRFRALYGAAEDDAFAMEIEFKVTAAGAFAIKQARPWVY